MLFSSVQELNKRFGDRLTWFVPSGMKKWMEDSGCVNVSELEWWQEKQIKVREQEITFACVPAVHWSKRGIRDDNEVVFFF